MDTARQDEFYLRAVSEYGPALARLARTYEINASQRLDLLQDMHFALWRSFAGFSGQCSLRTWVYRVAHNVGISKGVRRRRSGLASLEELADAPAPGSPEDDVHLTRALDRLRQLIRALRPPDDQVMLLYLEELDAQAIGEITGLSARAVATRIHRVKALLARHFWREGVP